MLSRIDTTTPSAEHTDTPREAIDTPRKDPVSWGINTLRFAALSTLVSVGNVGMADEGGFTHNIDNKTEKQHIIDVHDRLTHKELLERCRTNPEVRRAGQATSFNSKKAILEFLAMANSDNFKEGLPPHKITRQESKVITDFNSGYGVKCHPIASKNVGKPEKLNCSNSTVIIGPVKKSDKTHTGKVITMFPSHCTPVNTDKKKQREKRKKSNVLEPLKPACRFIRKKTLKKICETLTDS